MSKDELLALLEAERCNGGGWSTPEAPAIDDSELTTARRQRDLVAAWDEHKEKESA